MTLQIGFLCSPTLADAVASLRLGKQIYISGTYTFQVDGYAVNADEDSMPGAEPSWRVEVLYMSLNLLQNATAWRQSLGKGAGCNYDYVEFDIQPGEGGMLELRSFYTSETEGTRTAICSEAEFWPAFAAATEDWMAQLRQFREQIESENDQAMQARLQKLAREIALAKWEEAYTAWRAADQAAQISS